jgi:hypothetical protein
MRRHSLKHGLKGFVGQRVEAAGQRPHRQGPALGMP